MISLALHFFLYCVRTTATRMTKQLHRAAFLTSLTCIDGWNDIGCRSIKRNVCV